MNKSMDELRKRLVDIGPVLYEKFNKVTQAINTFAETLQKTTIKINELNVTDYNCTCGCKLIITGHNNTEIFYECIDCGKSYKAKKNKLLGRFQ